MQNNQYVPAGSYQLTSNSITITINASYQVSGNWVAAQPLTYTHADAANIGDIYNNNGALAIRPGSGTTPNPGNHFGKYVPAGSYQQNSQNITVTINAQCQQAEGNYIQSAPLTYPANNAYLITDLSNNNGSLDFNIPTISTQGKGFIDSNGNRFMVSGVALSADTAVNNTTDLLADVNYDYMNTAVVPQLVALNVNTIRVYQVDPTLSHTRVMRLLAINGIYVMVELVTPAICVDRMNPNYAAPLYQQGTSVVDAFHNCRNTFCFSVGNEVIFPGEMYTQAGNHVAATVKLEKECAAVMKSFIRDMKAYMAAQNYRAIPVGMAMQDGAQASLPNQGLIGTDIVAEFYASGDAASRADYIGINSYRYVNGGPMQSYDGLAAEVTSLPVPVFLTESGGLTFPPNPSPQTPPATRDWLIVSHMFQSSTLYSQLSGQVAFQFFEKGAYFGLFNQLAAAPLTETAWGGAPALSAQFLTCKGITLPATGTTQPPTNCAPSLLPCPAPNITVTINNYSTSILNAVQAGAVLAVLPAGSQATPSATSVEVSSLLELYILDPSNNWDTCCDVAVNVLQDGNTVDNNVAWGGSCTVSTYKAAPSMQQPA